jgi:microcystin-dependent protein
MLGASGGVEAVTLNTSQMPEHRHRRNNLFDMQGSIGVEASEYILASIEADNQVNTGRFQYAAYSGPVWGYILEYTANSGGGQPHDNMPPFVALRYCMVAVAPTVPVSAPNDLYVAQQEYWVCECCTYAEVRGGCDDGASTDDYA